mmetsp:Transcript_8065/g.49825  ORF Transcript_8065/g.49825 Transcript_8065/m.49825 type:complete len:220 (+) Transcript_8065:381-1040(+)
MFGGRNLHRPWPPRPSGRSALCQVESSFFLSHPNACAMARWAASCQRSSSVHSEETRDSTSLPYPTVIGIPCHHIRREECTHQPCMCKDKGKRSKNTREQCTAEQILHELEHQGLMAIQKVRLICARTDVLQDLNPGRMKFKKLFRVIFIDSNGAVSDLGTKLIKPSKVGGAEMAVCQLQELRRNLSSSKPSVDLSYSRRPRAGAIIARICKRSTLKDS